MISSFCLRVVTTTNESGRGEGVVCLHSFLYIFVNSQQMNEWQCCVWNIRVELPFDFSGVERGLAVVEYRVGISTPFHGV